MVEETVVTELLSARMKRVGKELLRRLDSARFPVSAALWFYADDAGVWRLIIAIPSLKITGPRKIYQKIQSIMAIPPKLTIGLQNIQIVDNQDPLINLLRAGFGSAPQISQKRVSQMALNGHFIEDAYMYRLLEKPRT